MRVGTACVEVVVMLCLMALTEVSIKIQGVEELPALTAFHHAASISQELEKGREKLELLQFFIEPSVSSGDNAADEGA